MGTNFYHRTNICSECGKYDERHIGKRSFGWQFSFRGYKDNEGKPIITSWQDWKRLIQEMAGKVVDEYGEEWNKEKFIEVIEGSKPSKSHYDYIWDTPHYGPSYLQDDWKDEEGWSFSTTEFC